MITSAPPPAELARRARVGGAAPPPCELRRGARLTGSAPVPLGLEPVLSLFTPRGERLWADGWDPQFPAPADDDSKPGTVFETVHGQQSATWVVCDRDAGRSIRYARIVHGQNAGTVTVTVDSREQADGSGTPRV